MYFFVCAELVKYQNNMSSHALKLLQILLIATSCIKLNLAHISRFDTACQTLSVVPVDEVAY